MSTVLSGVGAALPTVAIDNGFFTTLGVSDDWIRTRTGVSTRYRLKPDEQLVDLAVDAARVALASAGLHAGDIDFVVVSTSTPDRVSPGLAPEVAHLLGISGPGAVDLNGACTGFLYALDYAIARVEHGSSDRVLVIGAEAMSRIVNDTDRNTAVLFGDAAGAVIVEAGDGLVCQKCAPCLSFRSAGEYADALFVARDHPFVAMDGAEVYASAVEAMTDEIESVLLACEIDQDQLDLLICHQANSRILAAVARRLRCSAERAVSYVAEVGNTSSASIPVAMWLAYRDGRLRAGHRLGLAAFGAGFTWGAGLINWKHCGHLTPSRD